MSGSVSEATVAVAVLGNPRTGADQLIPDGNAHIRSAWDRHVSLATALANSEDGVMERRESVSRLSNNGRSSVTVTAHW